MELCEKCWADAFLRMQDGSGRSQADCYFELLEENKDKHGHPGPHAERKCIDCKRPLRDEEEQRCWRCVQYFKIEEDVKDVNNK